MEDVYIVERRFLAMPAGGWDPWFEKSSLVEACEEIVDRCKLGRIHPDPQEYRILLLKQLAAGPL